MVPPGEGRQAGGRGGIAVAVPDVVDGRAEVVDRIQDVAVARLGVGGERRRQHLHEPEGRRRRLSAGSRQVGRPGVERRLVLGDGPQGRGPRGGGAGAGDGLGDPGVGGGLRRRGTLMVGMALVVAFLPVVADGRGRVRAAGKAIILFILMDDMRSDGVMNTPAVLPKSKHWLAAAGPTFSNAFPTTSLCCPD